MRQFVLKLNEQELAIVHAGLQELKMRDASPVLTAISVQIGEQMKAEAQPVAKAAKKRVARKRS